MEKIQQILEDLTEEEMKRFRYLLGEHRVPAGKLENADAFKVVDLLKKFYKEKQKATNVVVDILESIPRMDLVDKLIRGKGLDELDGHRKHSVSDLERSVSHLERVSVEVKPDRVQDSALKQPINQRKGKANILTSSKVEAKDYGRDGKLRYPSLIQIALGFTISVLATASTILTPHSPFQPVLIPWWSGILFCVIGMIPLLPLRKSEKFKLLTILGMNIIGLLIAITSMGLSVWNGTSQNVSKTICMSSYHWIITFFAAIQLVLSGWIISLTSFWLDKEFQNLRAPNP
ncbi:uncharacterized protein LOC132834543 [Hemiscyllium ocellatum]|uniref:uncharacterized protein LOC132834543 n=1 Tax=Hemiscyllium ocellatum TaxID=170820 RepID=UPI0029660BE0|nr:uncharacterized protein LOC132834543 [Hemiscyllium ocellatum]